MSVTNIINNEGLTLVHGVGGIFFFEESWIKQNGRKTYCKDTSGKEMVTTKNDNNGTECSQTELWDLL